MKIKRYTAATMREALAAIRADQGDDAVILSSRRLEDGVEVVSAIDYDAELITDSGRPPLREPAPAAVREALAEPAATQPQYEEMKRELKDMRRLLDSELSALNRQERRPREPLNVQVLEELSALDIAPDIARALAAKMPRRTNARNPAHIPPALLLKFLPMQDDATCAEGGVLAIVGATGVGKTTTIAKLASRWVMQHGNDGLALVSTDGYRIGARDQLLTYARILGVPMHVANDGRELAHVLERLKSKRLVLIDTPGLGQRDARIAQQLDSLASGAKRARVLLALAASAESKTLDQIVRVYARVGPVACVLTKLDEAASLGGALSAVLRHRLPIAYLCDGQRVPEDLHAAAARRLWLIRSALRLKELVSKDSDERHLAANFGQVQAHA